MHCGQNPGVTVGVTVGYWGDMISIYAGPAVGCPRSGFSDLGEQSMVPDAIYSTGFAMKNT